MTPNDTLVSALYVVATPIGNLADITGRALETLRGADRILAEDTRHSRQLLQHYGIERPLVSLHEHNERERIAQVAGWLRSGEALALISDAGTPLISDPGYPLIAALRQEGLSVLAVPGPSAVIAALSVAGLPTDRFTFGGFLPARRGERERELKSALERSGTQVYFESPRRVADTLAALGEQAPEREVALCRELTKRFETCLAGTAASVADELASDSDQKRGEMVLIIRGRDRHVARESERLPVSVQELMVTLAGCMPPKKAAGEVARLTGAGKNEVYKNWLAHQNT